MSGQSAPLISQPLPFFNRKKAAHLEVDAAPFALGSKERMLLLVPARLLRDQAAVGHTSRPAAEVNPLIPPVPDHPILDWVVGASEGDSLAGPLLATHGEESEPQEKRQDDDSWRGHKLVLPWTAAVALLRACEKYQKMKIKNAACKKLPMLRKTPPSKN